MKIVIVPGWLSKPSHHWYSWLAKSLKRRGFDVLVLKMPNPVRPTLNAWLDVLIPHLENPQETILVGHSLGTFTILAALYRQRTKKKFPLVVLVSGFGRDILGLSAISRGFKGHGLDLEKIRRMSKRFMVITSDCDPFVSPLESIWLAYKLKAQLIIKPGAGHFTHFLGWKKIPFLLKIISDIKQKAA